MLEEETGLEVEMKKITRDAFLYLEPHKGAAEDFAQCSSCRMFLEKHNLCSILGPHITIYGGDSCGLYVPGGPAVETELEHVTASVTPEEAGLVHRPVRCENCAHYDKKEGDCELFEKLNEQFPMMFDLKEKVQPKACCNANTPKGGDWSMGPWLV